MPHNIFKPNLNCEVSSKLFNRLDGGTPGNSLHLIHKPEFIPLICLFSYFDVYCMFTGVMGTTSLLCSNITTL